MRLLVSAIPYDSGRSGISVYVREVLKELVDLGHEITLLCECGTEGETFNLGEASKSIPRVYAPKWTKRAPLSMAWHLFFLPRWIRRHRASFDAMVICAANRRVLSRYPLPTAATIHDLANFHIKGKYSRLRMFYLAHVLPHYAKRAQRLVAVSLSTKIDMVRFWGCRDEDVTVLYNGLSRGVAPSPVKGGSILYISRIEHPGKNHLRLIEAYGKLERSLAEKHPLIIAGADWKDADVVHAAASSSPNADLIRFTGFVDDAELERLWREETGFYIFPSLFEGFGLSLAEAMARGIPAAASQNGSLGEVAGDAAITFDPFDVESIAAALRELLTESEDLRQKRVERGIKRASMFSWRDHASGLVKLLEDASRPRTGGVVKMFGIPVSKVTEDEAVERIIALAKTPRPVSRASFVATLNVDFVSNAVKCRPFGGNEELWGYLKEADFVTADGMPIVLLAKLLGEPLPGRVTGADLVPRLCARAAKDGLSVYVLGGTDDSLKEAFAKLEAVAPGLKLAGTDSSIVKLDEDQSAVVERINAAKPDILFVALGNPKQELWMGRNASRLNVPVMIGIGGSFNFIAGRVKRAPAWMQRSGLEWIYRIIQEPGRLWKRYAYGLVKFSYLSLRHLTGGFDK